MIKHHKPKTVLLVRNAYRFDFGGGELFPINMAIELEKLGWKAVIASRSDKLLATAKSAGLNYKKGWWWSHQNWTGARIVLFPVYLIWQLFLFFWYLQLLIRLRPNIVHLQSRDDFIAGTFAAKLLGKKVIWTDHADLKYIYLNHSVWYKNPVGKLVYAAGLLTNKIVLVSQDEKKSIEKSLAKKLDSRYQVIHNGVPDIQVVPAKIKPAKLTFCATSRLVTAKGISELIEAYKTIRAELPDSQLLLVGDGPQTAKFKSQAGGIGGIEFIGHSDAALSYVAAADIFVHPSYHEGLSLSLVEAAMLAKPIIACAVGGNPEVVQNAKSGLLVAAKDSAALAAAMLKLANSPGLRQSYGQAARQAYQAGFNFSKIVAEEYLPIYEK